MSRLRWPDSTNSVSEKPGTIQCVGDGVTMLCDRDTLPYSFEIVG